uniref:Rab-GAP TBC domain-containing protein n=1 Tax=Rhabditophanes sp. KR3021 TaxID=114890 RepID=A0AC35TZJ2_9BILA
MAQLHDKTLCSIEMVHREPKTRTGQRILGTFCFKENPYGVYLRWDAQETDITFPDEESPPPQQQHSNLADKAPTEYFILDVNDLKSYYFKEPTRKSPPGDKTTSIQFISKDGSLSDRFHFQPLDMPCFTLNLQKHRTLNRSAKEKNLVIIIDKDTEALEKSVNLLNMNGEFLSRMVSNPYAASLTALGKVKNFVQTHLDQSMMLDSDAVSAEEAAKAMVSLQVDEEAENLMKDLISHDDQGFELISQMELPPLTEFYREAPITKEVFDSFKTADGRISRFHEIKQAIFRGGLSPEARPDAWKYLLNYYKWTNSASDNAKLRNQKEKEYKNIKNIWMNMDEGVMNRFTLFKEYRSLIEKDVIRVDRSHPFFSQKNVDHLQVMNDILTTYVMYNFDLGYVQGMSDYLATLMIVTNDEVDTFWCFVGLMERVRQNFDMDQVFIRTKLANLRDLLMVVNPRLVNHLESHESGHMFFCFRWLLVEFKREFEFKDIMTIWEVFWTDIPCQNFLLLFCLVILDKQSNIIINNNFGLTEILKHVNNLSMTIDFNATLTEAESRYHQLAALQDKLPRKVCDILGFNSSCE